MALLSNHHNSYQSSSEMLTPIYPTPNRSFEPLYQSPYTSPSYETMRAPYRDGYQPGGDITPRKDADGSDGYHCRETGDFNSITRDGYERGPYGVLTPLTPQRWVRILKKTQVKCGCKVPCKIFRQCVERIRQWNDLMLRMYADNMLN